MNRVHLQPRYIGADELPKRVEIAGPRLDVDAFNESAPRHRSPRKNG